MVNKKIWYIFYSLVLLSLLTPLWVFKELLFPYVTSKAFFFRMVVEAALPFYLFIILSDKNLRPKIKSPLNAAVLLFLLINIITSFTGANISRSLWGNFERMGGSLYLAHLVALFFYVQVIGKVGGNFLKIFFQTFVGVSVLVSLNGLSSWLGGPTLVLDASLPGRVSSTFGNPIFFASFLVIPIYLSGYLITIEQKKWLKVLYGCAILLQIFGIYISSTRGALVGLILASIVTLVLYIIFTENKAVKRNSLATLGILMALVVGLYLFHNKLPGGSTLYRIVNLNDKNTQARLIQWKMSLSGFKEHAITGVGPENYYVIFDKFFNPELYKYDPSWFDKPHNFILEVLTTNGIFGLLAYLAMSIIAILSLWNAYRAGKLGLSQACLLIAGILAYQIQNLFVFDTVSASVAFYLLLGVSGAWSYKKQLIEDTEQILENTADSKLIPKIALIGTALAVIFIGYAANIPSIEAAKRVNFGFGYTNYDAHIAAGYFNSALKLKFNLDNRETVNRYSDFLASVASNPPKDVTKDFLSSELKQAVGKQKYITENIKNDPLLWMRLAIDEMNLSIAENSDPKQSLYAINQAANLAPKRAEILQLYIQLDGLTKDWQQAVEISQKIAEIDPSNKDYKWQLAIAYYLNKQINEAVKVGDEAISMGMSFKQLQQFAWYIQYYEDKKDYAKLVPLLEQAVSIEPNEIGLYQSLAEAYAGIGDVGHAEALAKQIMVSDPSKKKQMEIFIKSIK